MYFNKSWKNLKNLFAPSGDSRAALRTAARFPELAQADYLRRLLRAQRDTAYGSAHGFAAIDDVAAYQAQVPIVDQETLRPWLAEVRRGVPNVLTREPVVALQQSARSGTLMPVTRDGLREVADALRPFFADWLHHHPQAAGAPWHYESLADDAGVTLGALPLLPASAWHPAQLLGGSVARRLSGLQLSPPKARTRQRFALLLRLLAQPDLAAMSLGDPAQAIALFEVLGTHLHELLRQLPADRAAEVGRLAAKGTLQARRLWPRLQRVSLWSDGIMAQSAAALQTFFAGVPLQAAPLGSAVAMLTVPQIDAAERGAPLAITSHFFEFIDLRAPRATPRLAHQLEVGGHYVPVVSTANGLYRLRLDDVVECTGYWEKVPRLAYVDKASVRSNLAGESLCAADVQVALQRSAERLQVNYRFALTVPQAAQPGHGPRYILYLDSSAGEAALQALATAFDAELCRLPAYWNLRARRALAQATVRRLQNGLTSYRRSRCGDATCALLPQPLAIDLAS